MKSSLRLVLFLLGFLVSFSAHAFTAQETLDGLDQAKAAITKKCDEMSKELDAQKQKNPDSAYILDNAHHAICECIPAKFDAIRAKVSSGELSSVTESELQAQLNAQVAQCVGGMARAMFSEQSCQQHMAKTVPNSPGYCHCLSAKIGAYSDADAMQLGLATSDYLPRVAAAKKQGLPVPEPPPAYKHFQADDAACRAK